MELEILAKLKRLGINSALLEKVLLQKSSEVINEKAEEGRRIIK
jgi:hypothetical protein